MWFGHFLIFYGKMKIMVEFQYKLSMNELECENMVFCLVIFGLSCHPVLGGGRVGRAVTRK